MQNLRLRTININFVLLTHFVVDLWFDRFRDFIGSDCSFRPKTTFRGGF